MLRPRGVGIARSYSGSGSAVAGLSSSQHHPSSLEQQRAPSRFRVRPTSAPTAVLTVNRVLQGTVLLVAVLFGMQLQQSLHIVSDDASSTTNPLLSKQDNNIPPGFEGLIRRAHQHANHCQRIGLVDHEDHRGVNNHTAHLPQFGIL